MPKSRSRALVFRSCALAMGFDCYPRGVDLVLRTLGHSGKELQMRIAMEKLKEMPDDECAALLAIEFCKKLQELRGEQYA
jgi:hypothetical protein